MSLHDRIMNVRVSEDLGDHGVREQIIYKTGHRDARHKAATLAAEADELMDRMAEALRGCAEEDADGLDAAMARDTLEMYNNWKEQTND